MRIQGISFFYNDVRINKKNNNGNANFNKQEIKYTTPSINFEAARVDKGLTRFYEVNAGRMPQTVKTYIEKLGDKTLFTPLTAQRNAFTKLREAKNVNDIKRLFPDETLFKNLIDPEQSKATRGILGIFRENKELLELCNQGILLNNENLTVYLVKKIFLEGKTLDEMNEDLRKDGNPEFLAMYDSKEGGKLLRGSTLKALGIEQPEFEYLQSLRYTRDGYSDLVGEKISQVQRAFWESMPVEERTARARRSVEKFENWWNSMTRDQQLDKIAAQADELELLEEFNKSEFGKTKKAAVSQAKINKTAPVHQKTGVTSTLSRDDLFKIWAANNLKMFTANLSELDKRTLQIKRTQNAAQKWERMTPAEKTEYISRLKTGSEPLKYAMIDAWNNNPDIIVKMSIFLKKQQINKPVDTLYSDEQLGSFMSEVMTKFWEEYPDFAAKLGNSIKDSHLRIKNSISNGNFYNFKAQILKDKKNRIKEVAQMIKDYREVNINYDGFRPIAKEFAITYQKNNADLIKILPDEYLQDFFNVSNEHLSHEQLASWIKLMKDEETLTLQDIDNINSIKSVEPKDAKIMNRAIEAALADILYFCTGNPDVFMMSQADLKTAIRQMEQGRKQISLFSEKNNQKFELSVLQETIDTNLIKKLYNWYKTPLNNYDINTIIEQFFSIQHKKYPDGQKQLNDAQINNLVNLCEYIYSYGHSIFIPFSQTNYPPEAKAAFMKKFVNNMPDNIDDALFSIRVWSLEDFRKEDNIKSINNIINHKYNFLPEGILELYNFELNKMLRTVDQTMINNFKKIVSEYKKITEGIYVKGIRFRREIFNKINTLYFLCAEQTIADTLYRATNEPKVYALTLEELFDAIDALRPINKLTPGIREVESSILNEKVQLKLKSKLNFYKNDKIFEEYKNELLKYLNELNQAEDSKIKPDKTELLYILNPDETQKEIDKYTMLRIKSVEKYF